MVGIHVSLLWCVCGVDRKGVPLILGDRGDGGDCPHVTSPDKTFVGKD